MTELELGDTLFDEDGNEVGMITGLNADGFYVSINGEISGTDQQRMAKRGESGQAELTWQCMKCGEIGEIDDMPENECPSCGAPKTELFYAIQD